MMYSLEDGQIATSGLADFLFGRSSNWRIRFASGVLNNEVCFLFSNQTRSA